MDPPPPGGSGANGSEEVESDANQETIPDWNLLPEHLLLRIFCYLSAQSVLNCSLMCSKWHRITYDELLWKKLFYHDYNIDPSIPMSPGKKSWMEEYKRLSYHTPSVESEVLYEHKDQVLHVSFSRNGDMFATCSKDGFVKVWNSTYPVTLRYKYNMKMLTWKYTQFSQFNETDTLLLVSGVHFGVLSTSGEIAVFSLIGEFQLQCRVLNKPYDVFGTWYNSNYLLSGSLLWFGPLQSCSALWLNKAFRATDSEHESVVMRLYRFNNVNASSIRAIMIANCVTDEEEGSKNEGKSVTISTVPSNTDSKTQGILNSKEGGNCATRNPKQKNPVLVTSCTRAHNCPNCLKRRADKKAQKAVASSNGDQKQRSCKTLQCLTVMEDGRLQSRMLEVEGEETDEQLNGTIEYNEDYRKAEVTWHEGSDCNDPVKSCDGLSAGKENLLNFKCPCIAKNSHYSEPEGACVQNSCKNNAEVEPYSCSCCCNLGPNSGQPEVPEECTNYKPDLDHTQQGRLESSLAMASVLQEDKTKMNSSKSSPKFQDKYLIFTTGSKTYTPHQIGIKKVQSLEAMRYKNVEETGEGVRLMPNVEDSQPGSPLKFDEVDHLIELDGHIIGMCLSPDHRYLYVNSRPWPENYYIENPLYPPPIAQEIDIHVIDLLHMKEVGTMHRSHKAYTPNDECFFIFLDVCDEFVASGAEDKFGYLWDRHYGLCLHKFPHKDVVNSVAFHPKNREMLVTVSDDHTVKIWRSRNLERQYRLEREKAAALAREKGEELPKHVADPIPDPDLDLGPDLEAAQELETKQQ